MIDKALNEAGIAQLGERQTEVDVNSGFCRSRVQFVR